MWGDRRRRSCGEGGGEVREYIKQNVYAWLRWVLDSNTWEKLCTLWHLRKTGYEQNVSHEGESGTDLPCAIALCTYARLWKKTKNYVLIAVFSTNLRFLWRRAVTKNYAVAPRWCYPNGAQNISPLSYRSCGYTLGLPTAAPVWVRWLLWGRVLLPLMWPDFRPFGTDRRLTEK